MKKNWEYILYKENQKYLLEVVCGGAAMFELKIELNIEEVNGYLSHGESYIDQLAEMIRNSPSQYLDRKIE
ncbi:MULTISPECIES: hypothetical protein [unclassified Chryseobacterium]|uniref:hypothetical protein n=1 Tax=unclassified Chryseobacterium TaxID=2593645 RepID=UPI00103C571C|nr:MULTISPECIES: hypothetical protein [unclassified Chryseobacterium]